MELFKKDEITDVQSRLNYAENPIQNEQDFSDSIRKTVFGGYDRKSVEQYIVSARSDMQRVIAQLEQQLGIQIRAPHRGT